jgi:hypothetical protein
VPRTAGRSKAGGFKVRTGKSGFKEEEHPRGRAGQFREKPGEGKEAAAGRTRQVPVRKKPGARVPAQVGTPSQKAILAKQSAKYVGKDIQRYSEEHNEPILAAGLKRSGSTALTLRDNEPADVLRVRGGKITDGIELKTQVIGANDKITMKASAQTRKAAWMRENQADFHTVVFDDRKVFNAGGEGKHDDTQRVMLYRRGFGSFRTGGMHRVADMDELDRLLSMPAADLPSGARPPAGYAGFK